MDRISQIGKITILGDGGWGTTLARLLALKGYKVRLWGAFKKNIQAIVKARVNQKFLPGIKLPDTIRLTWDLPLAVQEAGLIVLAIPSPYLRKVLKRLKHLDISSAKFLTVIKGIETKTLMRISQVIRQELKKGIGLAVLSGPTIALEVAKGIPTTAVISSPDKKLAQSLQHIFMTERFRIYTNPDMIGVELGGSLKNIIAIACGICDGLGFGANTKAALLTRGLVEISRLGAAMGAQKDTFSGLSGLGDLVTTCISPYSRNRYLGEQIGKGKRLKKILSETEMVAEGVTTAKSAYQLSKKYKISMPITEQVYLVLYKNKIPLKAVNDLMTRERKEE